MLRTTTPVIAADLFCGAGGTSTGLAEACQLLGRPIDLTAVNHWRPAILTHKLNHPAARHLETSIDNINPRDLYPRGELELFWASPECTHHSTARGGMPINEQSRATAWCVTRWAEAIQPKIILIENVPEFTSWGPLVKVRAKDRKTGKMKTVWRPDPKRKGEIFQAWLNTLRAAGYRVEYRTLCCADYGDPTTRTRLFIHARRDRRRIVWPHPTHSAAPGAERPWRPVAECIDWDHKGKSAFDRKKALSQNTLKRIMVGLRKQGVQPFILPKLGIYRNNQTYPVTEPLKTVIADGRAHLIDPFIISMEHGGRTDSIDQPLRTVTTAKGGATALAEPIIIELRGTQPDQIANTSKKTDKPLGTVTAGGIHHGLTEFIVQVAHGNGTDPNGDVRRVKPLDEPAPTICGNRGDLSLVQPMVVGQQSGATARPVGEPGPTVAATGAISLIEPFLVKFYGTAHTASVHEPAPTCTARDRFALAKLETRQPDTTIRVDAIVKIGDDTYPLSNVDGTHCLICLIDGAVYLVGILFRMLTPRELAAAQGFRPDYQFTGNRTETVKQIGNAVPRHTSRALALAALTGNPDVASILYPEPATAAA